MAQQTEKLIEIVRADFSNEHHADLASARSLNRAMAQPMNYDNLNDLELLASRAGLNESELSSYLKFIKAPSDFKNAQAAVIGFKRMLSVPWVTDLKTTNLEEALVINSRLEHALATSPDLAQFTISTNTLPRKLARGMLGDLPEYTILFFHSQSHHTLIEQMKQLVWLESPEATHKDVYDYCLFIRVLSESHIPQIMVDRFQTGPVCFYCYQTLSESSNLTKSKPERLYKLNMLTNAKSALRYLSNHWP